MSPRHSAVAVFLAACLEVMASPAHAGAPVKEIPVVGPRVSLADVVPGVPATIATADLGPAPAPGGSRFVTQDELKTAATGAPAKVIASLPAAVRLVRKMKPLSAADLDRETRKAVLAAGLRKGVTIGAVRAPKLSEVAEGFTSITASVPKPPRRTGRIPTTATLTFQRGSEILARLAVPIDLDLSADAAIPDIAKGAAVTVTVKAGLVEISTAALAGADADIGDELPITLRPSGKMLRATLVAPGRAVLVTATAPSPTDDSASPAPVSASPATVPAPDPSSTSAPVAPAPSTVPVASAPSIAPVAPPAPSIAPVAPPAPSIAPAAPSTRPSAPPRASTAPAAPSVRPSASPRASTAPAAPSMRPSAPPRASMAPGAAP